MKEFIILLLTKLGLGVGARVKSIEELNDNIHNFLGYDFITEVNSDNNTITITYLNDPITLHYTIINNVIKNIEI